MAEVDNGPVQLAWDNHFAAFGAQDVERILQDYSEDSVVTVFDQTTGAKTVHSGLAGVRECFDGLFKSLFDCSALDAPVQNVQESTESAPGSVFLIWSCPSSGYSQATDTFVFDSSSKILWQNVVVSYQDPKGDGTVVAKNDSEVPSGSGAVHDGWANHFSAFGSQDVEKILLDYTEESEITVFNHASGSNALHKGLDGARTCFEGLFKSLFDCSNLSAPIIHVEESVEGKAGEVFLCWAAPASGYLRATDTFIFNSAGKITRQNVVVHYEEPAVFSPPPRAAEAAAEDEEGEGNAAPRAREERAAAVAVDGDEVAAAAEAAAAAVGAAAAGGNEDKDEEEPPTEMPRRSTRGESLGGETEPPPPEEPEAPGPCPVCGGSGLKGKGKCFKCLGSGTTVPFTPEEVLKKEAPPPGSKAAEAAAKPYVAGGRFARAQAAREAKARGEELPAEPSAQPEVAEEPAAAAPEVFRGDAAAEQTADKPVTRPQEFLRHREPKADPWENALGWLVDTINWRLELPGSEKVAKAMRKLLPEGELKSEDLTHEESLSDGKLLVCLMMAVKPDALPKPNAVALGRIAQFLKACGEVGVRKTDIFTPPDLMPAPPQNAGTVLRCIMSLAGVAQAWPDWVGPKLVGFTGRKGAGLGED